MTVVKGLKNINALVEKPKTESSGIKVRWVKLADGQSAKIRFVNELDSDSAHYNEGRGLAVVVSEHTRTHTHTHTYTRIHSYTKDQQAHPSFQKSCTSKQNSHSLTQNITLTHL